MGVTNVVFRVFCEDGVGEYIGFFRFLFIRELEFKVFEFFVFFFNIGDLGLRLMFLMGFILYKEELIDFFFCFGNLFF